MIQIFNYIEKLIHIDDVTFTATLDQISQDLSSNQPYPFNFFVQASIRNSVKPFATDASRDEKLQHLLNFDLAKVGRASCERVSTLLPSPINDIQTHIFPAIEKFGGGCTIAPGKILVSVKIDDLAPARLQRNVAHEFSHGVRMTQKPQATEHGYGEVVPYTVRDYLIFEGLAGVLCATLYPAPIPAYNVSDEEEEAWWNGANLEVVDSDGYIKYISLKAYEIGSRIVRAYMQKHSISIIEAHYVSDKELFWDSGYEHIK